MTYVATVQRSRLTCAAVVYALDIRRMAKCHLKAVASMKKHLVPVDVPAPRDLSSDSKLSGTELGYSPPAEIGLTAASVPGLSDCVWG